MTDRGLKEAGHVMILTWLQRVETGHLPVGTVTVPKDIRVHQRVTEGNDALDQGRP